LRIVNIVKTKNHYTKNSFFACFFLDIYDASLIFQDRKIIVEKYARILIAWKCKCDVRMLSKKFSLWKFCQKLTKWENVSELSFYPYETKSHVQQLKLLQSKYFIKSALFITTTLFLDVWWLMLKKSHKVDYIKS
jgi:hypothetical protein